MHMARTEKKGPMKPSRKVPAGARSKPEKPAPSDEPRATGKEVLTFGADPPLQLADPTAAWREMKDAAITITANEKAMAPSADLAPAIKASPQRDSPSTMGGSALVATGPDTSATATESKTHDDDAHLATATTAEQDVAASEHRPDGPLFPPAVPPAGRETANEASPAQNPDPTTAAGEDSTRTTSPAADAAGSDDAPPGGGGPSDPVSEASPSGRSRRARKVPAKLADAAVAGLSGRGRGAPRQPAKRPRDDAPAAELAEASTATVAHVGEHTPSSQATVAGPPAAKRSRKGAPRRAAE
eukprot:jgi/Ulvmu1/9419/UM051_0047.1